MPTKIDRDTQILSNNIVSDKTLRTDHLLCSFYNYIKRYNPDEAKRIYSNPEDAKTLDEAAVSSSELVSGWVEYVHQTELLQELEDVLNDMSPSGYTFGNHPGDGACFRYWKNDEGE